MNGISGTERSLAIERSYATKWLKIWNANKWLLLLSVPGLACTIVFKYIPMYGILIGFMKNYNPSIPFFQNEWVGFRQFETFIGDPNFFKLFRNTILLGLYSLLWGFPVPILLALLLNEVRNKAFKKITQTITYLPYFLSTVVIIGILKSLTAMDTGIFNIMLKQLGLQQIIFFAEPDWFRTIYVASAIWAGAGFGSIIYLAALSGVDVEQYEAAVMDGANRWKSLIHITLPSIAPTITVMLILSVGGILGNDFVKIYLMYSPVTYETADVISTYVYRQGIENANYSYSTAVGLFGSVVSLFFLAVTNYASRKLSDTSLW